VTTSAVSVLPGTFVMAWAKAGVIVWSDASGPAAKTAVGAVADTNVANTVTS